MPVISIARLVIALFCIGLNWFNYINALSLNRVPLEWRNQYLQFITVLKDFLVGSLIVMK